MRVASVALLLFLAAGVSALAQPVLNLPTYPLPPDVFAFASVVGSDGNLWLAGRHVTTQQRYLFRVDANGAITQFPLAVDVDVDSNLAATPGFLWIRGRNSIARISLAGELTVFPIPGPRLQPGFSIGPDGNIWFAQELPTRLGRITHDGTITTFATPFVGTIWDMATSGGVLWVLPYDGNLLYRVSSTGAILSTITLPFSTIAGDVASYPDGGVVVTSGATGPSLARYDAAGNLVRYLPTANGEIAVDANGRIWLANGDRFGYLDNDERPVWFTTGIPPQCSVARYNFDGPRFLADGSLWMRRDIALPVVPILPPPPNCEAPVPRETVLVRVNAGALAAGALTPANVPLTSPAGLLAMAGGLAAIAMMRARL